MMDRRTQTIFVIGMALSAFVGAIGGAFMGAVFSSQISSLSRRLDRTFVDQTIVELIEEESATIAVVDRVTPSVVSIVVKKKIAESADSLIEISSGSGFFVSTDGLILTNRHVVDEEEVQFFVVTNDGEEYPASLIDTDPFLDIAVLRVDGLSFSAAPLGDSEQIQIGQTVIAIGNTLSEFRNTVTKGVVSGINRRVTASSAATAEVIEQAIQTDAAINPGNSGGPLINLHGEVIGINTAVSVQGEAIAFAIPINQAKRAIEDVRQHGRIIRPWLGVRYVLVQPETGGEQTPLYELGAMIVSGNQPGQPGVLPGSPAALAGLQEEDVIIKIGGISLTKERSLSELVSSYRPGDQVDITFLRNDILYTQTVILAEYNP